ncbi:MFS transporter [Arthrobacter bambusae]|uniref:MFS transporter n=1 Tax=Arthrobacter bambusae TaxID=1338426 RepID=UPI001F514A7A|nr:MFS transporter [Arthrobacter bambusae]MCI0143902.1 MFS transporter [Arthrobacter bambusae]
MSTIPNGSTPLAEEPPRTRKNVLARLSVMMLLQYATFGAWWATFGLVLITNNLGATIGTAFTLAAVAAMVSPLFTGAIADRYFSSQKVLGVLHIGGGLVMLVLGPLVLAQNAVGVLVAILVYMLIFMPTGSLTSSIVFAHLPAHSTIFPFIRAFGTAGWIIVGLFVGQSGLSASTTIFTIAGVMSFVTAIYCFTLPKTAPPQRGAKFAWGDVVGAGAFHLFRNRSFVILTVSILLVSVPISIYNAFGAAYLGVAGVPNVASVMTIGQAAELAFLVLVPLVLRRFSIKSVLLAGLLAWVLRAGLFLMMTDGNLSLAIVIVALHGVTNDFFLMVTFIYANEVARENARHQVQALMLFIAFGVGNFVGAWVAGEFYNSLVAGAVSVAGWAPMWYLTMALTGFAAVLMVLFFRSPERKRIEDFPAETLAPLLGDESTRRI